MTDYFGYQPTTVPSYVSMNDTYVPPDQSGNEEYKPTNWDSVDIVKMWTMVQAQSDERAFAVADMWRRTAALLQATRDHLQRHATVLQGKWNSEAGKYFMERVGAALYSLDEWHGVAKSHQEGVEQVGNAIQKAQRDLKPIYERYLAREKDQQSERDNGFLENTFTLNWDGSEDQDEVKAQFHEEAKNVTKPLADTFIDVYIDKVNRGGKYKGPTNAVVTDPSSVPKGGPTRPGAPGRPSMRGAPPTRPTMTMRPTTPGTKEAPPPPPPPGGVELAGITTAPPPPATPTLPATPTATPPPSTPMVPGVPGIPSSPGSSTTNRGPAPTRPNLPGSQGGAGGSGSPGAGRRGAAPSRPTLPGSQGGGGGPRSGPGPGAGRRGAAPSRPTLPGKGGSPGMRPPGGLGSRSAGKGGGPSSPRLPGSTASRPGAGGPGTGPARPAKPQLPGRGNEPGTPGRNLGQGKGQGQGPEAHPTQPKLTGRGAAGRPAPTAGPDPALGGRRGAQVPPAQRGSERRPAEDERDTWVYGEGDELWATESEAVATVEAPAEHKPQQQGKALGQG